MYYIGLALGISIQGIEYKYIYPKYTWPRSVFIAHAWSGGLVWSVFGPITS